MQKRIAIKVDAFTNQNFESGGEKVNFFIIKALYELGYEIDIYCINNNSANCQFVKNIFVMPREEILETNTSNYLFTLSENLYYEGDIRYIHENTRFYRDKYTRSLIEKLACKVFKKKRFIHNKNLATSQKEISNKSNLLIVPSTFIKEDLIESYGVDETKIRIIPPFCTITTENYDHKQNKVFTFGMSARGFDTKGGYQLILSMILLKLKKINCQALVIYPFSKTAQKLQTILKLFGINIKFISYCKDMNEFYEKIDCLIMASKREAFGLVAIEAMARKIPVIINTRCGVKDMIVNEKNGFIYDYSHPIKNLYKTMFYVYQNQEKLENITQEAYSVIQDLEYEKIKSKLENVINEYLNTII